MIMTVQERNRNMGSEYISKNAAAKRMPLAYDVANKIADYISQKPINPGERLPNEFELAEMFNVGRGSVREAVKLLISRNVVEIRPPRGTFVCDQPGLASDPMGLNFAANKVEMTRDMLEIRLLLERYAVRNAALKAGDDVIEKLQSIADKIQENLTDYQACTQYDIAFHKCIAENCGNSVMPLILPVIHKNIADFNSLQFERQWDLANQGHYTIVQALKERNPDLAEAQMVAHLHYASERMKTATE